MKHDYEEYDYADELRGDYPQESDYRSLQVFRICLIGLILVMCGGLSLYRYFS